MVYWGQLILCCLLLSGTVMASDSEFENWDDEDFCRVALALTQGSEDDDSFGLEEGGEAVLKLDSEKTVQETCKIVFRNQRSYPVHFHLSRGTDVTDITLKTGDTYNFRSCEGTLKGYIFKFYNAAESSKLLFSLPYSSGCEYLTLTEDSISFDEFQIDK